MTIMLSSIAVKEDQGLNQRAITSILLKNNQINENRSRYKVSKRCKDKYIS